MNEVIYQGNCKNSFDLDGKSLIDCFNDVTDFAQSVDISEEVEYELFFHKTGSNKKYDWYFWDMDSNIFYGYDDKKDIHDIFA